MRKKKDVPIETTEEREPATYRIVSISTSSGKGYEYSVVSSTGGEYLLLLSPAQYKEQSVAEGDVVDEETFEALRYANQQFNAYTKGLDILNYGENNRHQLVYKLMKKGFSRGLAIETAEKLAKNGYIDEKKQISMLIHEYANRRYYGKKRIVSELTGKYYDLTEVEAIGEEEFPKIDFVEKCAYIISRKFLPLPRDKEGLNRMLAGLVRYGYNVGEIKEAIARLAAAAKEEKPQ